MTINSGTGGTDAADFAEMLLRMYLRWAERHGYPTEVYDTSYAEEAGIKSGTFVVKTPFAYGTLAGEHGRHALAAAGQAAVSDREDGVVDLVKPARGDGAVDRVAGVAELFELCS